MRHVSVLFPLAFIAPLVTSAFFTAPTADAQDSTPASMSTPLPPLLQQMVEAANAGAGAAVAALYAEDGIHEDLPAGVVARGRGEIAAFVDGVQTQVRGLRLEPNFAHLVGDLAVLEYTLTGTDVATDRPFVSRGVLVFELDGTLIRRSADYYDLAAILGQLGQLPPGAPTPGATPAA